MDSNLDTIDFFRLRLPHWFVADASYFVTICIKNSIPYSVLQDIKNQLKEMSAYNATDLLVKRRNILLEVEKHLDTAPKALSLTEPSIAEILMESIEFREKQDIWQIHEYVIMPTHIHLFLYPLKGDLRQIITQFKRWTTTQLRKNGEARKQLWMREWFDHWSRSPEQGQKIQEYIRNNPVKACLISDSSYWPYGSWQRRRPGFGEPTEKIKTDQVFQVNG